MKITISKPIEYNATTLRVLAGVRYWEDATVNGKEDTNGDLMPFRSGDMWSPVIAIDTGVILGWPQGTTAKTCYKVCDNFRCSVESDTGEVIQSYEGYAPSFMSPDDDGFGDYIQVTIDSDGKIDGWKFDMSQLEEEE